MDDGLIAEQLTLIEYDFYQRIEAPELLGQAWNKDKKQCLSRNVIEQLQRTNRVSFWVSTLILLQSKVKDRVKAVVKFIGVANRLRQLHNYNTLMGLVAGFNTSSVSRLKHTFNAIKGRNKELWDELMALMDPSNSFRTLRHAIDESGLSAIPYLGMYLSDLTFMEDGNPDEVERNGRKVINFQKHFMIYKTIHQLLRFQTSAEYIKNIKRVEPAYTFLYELCALDENVLYALSLEREPRGAAAKDID
jgi:hypothetical protein